MHRFWQTLYSILIIPMLWVLLHAAGLLNEKVRRGIRGRDGLFEHLEEQARVLMPGTRVWVHSSSMGEFEQAKPIIAELKQRYPSLRVIVTFFSPSGYEHSRRYPLADLVSYLPFDSLNGARRFFAIVRPDIALLVRYDIWPNHIWEAKRRKIPVIIANATLRRQTARLLPVVRSFYRSVYNAITGFLVVSESDAESFRLFALDHPTIETIGDSRFDQVLMRSEEAKTRQIVPPHVLEGRRVLVAGSCWSEDEAVLVPAYIRLLQTIPNLLVIHVPHEPTSSHLENVEARLDGYIPSLRCSAVDRYQHEQLIVVDSVGLLLALYSSAHVAFIGGSFKQGIHNVLEAAVFGIPVVFGPKYDNSQEPLMLVERGGAFVVGNVDEFVRTVRSLLENEAARVSVGRRASEFVAMHTGATKRLLASVEPHITRSTHSLMPVEAQP
jgi:3-deoxy-D-manno-octulosonic-acid transferase